MTAYYNEHDAKAAAWLRELIAAGLIAPGEVDTRSIEDVLPNDLAGFTQCHFFAGIGVWSYALRRAGWPDDRPVWTGSCPCQPFSAAGKGAGTADERHLWPAFNWLISQRQPAICFGEQVGGGAGEHWLDHVFTDLESQGYACGAATFPACSVGAPHIRQRMYWVANANRGATGRDTGAVSGAQAQSSRARQDARRGADRPRHGGAGDDSLANANGAGRERRWLGEELLQPGQEQPSQRLCAAGEGCRPVNGFWRAADWLHCTDGKWRAVEPGSKPLVNGTPARVVSVCSYCQTRAIRYEDMLLLRDIPSRNERRSKEEVLLQRMHDQSSLAESTHQQEYGSLSSEKKEEIFMREVRREVESSGSSQGQKPTERQQIQPGDALSELPLSRARGKQDVVMRRLWRGVQGCVPSEQEQDLFCPVCERVGPHQCSKEMASRVGELRGFGNALVAPQAEEFIRCVMGVI